MASGREPRVFDSSRYRTGISGRLDFASRYRPGYLGNRISVSRSTSVGSGRLRHYRKLQVAEGGIERRRRRRNKEEEKDPEEKENELQRQEKMTKMSNCR